MPCCGSKSKNKIKQLSKKNNNKTIIKEVNIKQTDSPPVNRPKTSLKKESGMSCCSRPTLEKDNIGFDDGDNNINYINDNW